MRRVRYLAARHPPLNAPLLKSLGNGLPDVIICAALFSRTTIGVQTTSVAAITGAACLAIGPALQDALSHVASGVLHLFFRPIRAGDFVEISAGWARFRRSI